MDGTQWLEQLASELAQDLMANNRIKQFADNTDLIGAYAEATVRRLVAQIVAPLRVSRGGIIYEGVTPKDVKQLDTIVWQPGPMPALFETGDFGLVPRGSALAILEIKRSNYSGAGKAMDDVLAAAPDLLPEVTLEQTAMRLALGVICLYDQTRGDAVLAKHIADKQAVALLNVNTDNGIVPNIDGVLHLVNFLALTRLLAKQIDGKQFVNWPLGVQ